MLTYEDPTCDEGCNVVEGFWMVTMSYLGMLYYKDRGEEIAKTTMILVAPDKGMTPMFDAKMGTLEERAPEMHKIFKDKTDNWIP